MCPVHRNRFALPYKRDITYLTKFKNVLYITLPSPSGTKCRNDIVITVKKLNIFKTHILHARIML